MIKVQFNGMQSPQMYRTFFQNIFVISWLGHFDGWNIISTINSFLFVRSEHDSHTYHGSSTNPSKIFIFFSSVNYLRYDLLITSATIFYCSRWHSCDKKNWKKKTKSSQWKNKQRTDCKRQNSLLHSCMGDLIYWIFLAPTRRKFF